MKVYVVGNSQRPFLILIDVLLLLTSVIVNLFLSVPLLLILNAVIFSWLVFYGTIHYIIS